MSVNKSKQTKVNKVRTRINKSQTALRHTRSDGHRRRTPVAVDNPKRRISGVRTNPEEKPMKLSPIKPEESKREDGRNTKEMVSDRRPAKGVTNTSVWQEVADSGRAAVDFGLEDKKSKDRKKHLASKVNNSASTNDGTSGHHVQKSGGQGNQGAAVNVQTVSYGSETARAATTEKAKSGATEAAGGAATGGVSTVFNVAKRTLRKTREELEAPIIQADMDNGEAGNSDVTKTGNGQRSTIAITMMSVVAAMVQLMMPVILAIMIPSIIIAMLVGVLTSVLTPVVQMTEAQESIVTDASELLDSLDDETAKAILEEAFKYEGKPYKFGGTDPNNGIDCAAFTQWCYRKVGIGLPRTAQGQYDAVQHISMEDAKPGDLVFFTKTYKTNRFITHVELYVGGGRSFGAGSPIGYHNLSSKYHSEHYVCCGRVGGEKKDDRE